MKCSNCGSEVKKGAAFCRQCGASITWPVCDSCGSPLEEGAEFCNVCGRHIGNTQQPADTYQPAEPEKKVCPSCGESMKLSAAFCTKCGMPFSVNDNVDGTQNISQQSQPTPMENSNTYTSGQESDVPSYTRAYEAPVKPKKKRTGLVIAISIIVALVLACGAAATYMAFNNIWIFDDSKDAVSDNKDGKDDGKSSSKEDEDDSKGNEEESSEDELPVTPIDSSNIDDIITQNSSYTTFGIYVRNLTNGYEFGYNQDNTFLASAMGQVVILDTLSRIVDSNNIYVPDQDIYFSYLANGKEAPTSKNENGEYVDLQKCIEDVAVYGDNNKSNHLVDYIGQFGDSYSTGFDVINDTLDSNGYYNTQINRKTFIDQALVDNSVPPNATTPYEIGNIFENLINNSSLGNKDYMTNIFKSVGNNGQAIGLKKYIPAQYRACNANALTNQVTNDVAVISDGSTEIVVAILSTTDESKTSVENNAQREQVQAALLTYILDTQFGE